jgi:hypothetical protein
MKILIASITAIVMLGIATLLSNRLHAEDLGQCKARCEKEFRACSDNGTKNVAQCLKRRAACINGCN